MILTNQNCPNCRNNVKPEHMSSEGLLELAIHNILCLTVAVVHKDKKKTLGAWIEKGLSFNRLQEECD